MAFCLNTSDMPGLNDYAACEKFYNKTKPWRDAKDYGAARPLAINRQKKHVSIRLKNDAWHLRYHNTDVVIYRPDSTIEINTYASMSTNAFANTCLPGGVWADFNKGDYSCLWLSQPGYDTRRGYNSTGMGPLIIRPSHVEPGRYELASEPKPFTYRVVDGKAGFAALKKHRYAEFREWLPAFVAMGGRGMLSYTKKLGWMSDRLVVEMLDDPDQWPMFVPDPSNNLVSHTTMSVILTLLRNSIYKEEGCVIEQQVPYLDSHSQQAYFQRCASKFD